MPNSESPDNNKRNTAEEEIKLPEAKKEFSQEITKETKKALKSIKVKVKIEETKPIEFQEIKESSKETPQEQQIKIPELKKPSLRLPEIKMPEIKMPSFNSLLFWKKLFDIKPKKTNIKIKKQISIILSFVLILGIGYFIFQKQDRERIQENELIFETVRQQMAQAEVLIASENTDSEKAKTGAIILTEALKGLNSIISTESEIKAEVENLKNQIDNDLKNFYNFSETEDLNVIYDFSDGDFIPQNIVSDEKNLYLFSQYAKDIFKINLTGETSFVQTEEKISSAIAIDENDILFFHKTK